MSATIAPLESDVMGALRSFITGVIGNGGGAAPIEVVRGLGNRVPMPPNPFISITPISERRLATNVDTYTSDQKLLAQASIQMDVQIDCYGPSGHDWAKIISILMRDEYGCTQLAPNCQPLYADEPRMMPLIDAEQQYEERWMLLAALQYDPVVTVAQQSALAAKVTLVNVDVAYPQ